MDDINRPNRNLDDYIKIKLYLEAKHGHGFLVSDHVVNADLQSPRSIDANMKSHLQGLQEKGTVIVNATNLSYLSKATIDEFLVKAQEEVAIVLTKSLEEIQKLGLSQELALKYEMTIHIVKNSNETPPQIKMK